eukprot:gene24948-30142_t
MGNLLSSNNPVLKGFKSSLVGSLLPSPDLQAFFEICRIEEQTHASIASLKLNPQSCFYLVLVGEITVYGNNEQVQSVDLNTYVPGDTIILLPGLAIENGAVVCGKVRLTYQHRSTDEPGKLLIADRAAVEKFLSARPHLTDLNHLWSTDAANVADYLNIPYYKGLSISQMQLLVSALRLRVHKPMHALRFNVPVTRVTKHLKKVSTDGLTSLAMSDGTIGVLLRGRCVAGSDPVALAQAVQQAYSMNSAKGGAIAPSAALDAESANPLPPGIKGPGFLFGYERTLIKNKTANQSLHSVITLDRSIVGEIAVESFTYLCGLDKSMRSQLTQNMQISTFNHLASVQPFFQQLRTKDVSLYEKLRGESQLVAYHKGEVLTCGECLYVVLQGSLQAEGDGDGEEHTIMTERSYSSGQMLFDFNGYFASLIKQGCVVTGSKGLAISPVTRTFQCLSNTILLTLSKRTIEDTLFGVNTDMLCEMYLYLLGGAGHGGTVSNMRLEDVITHSVARPAFIQYLTREKGLKSDEVESISLILELYEDILRYDAKLHELIAFIQRGVSKKLRKKLKKIIAAYHSQNNKLGSFVTSPGAGTPGKMGGLNRSEKSAKNVTGGGGGMMASTSRAKSFFSSQVLIVANDDDSDTDMESDEDEVHGGNMADAKESFEGIESELNDKIVALNALTSSLIKKLQGSEGLKKVISETQVARLLEIEATYLLAYSPSSLYTYLTPLVLAHLYPASTPHANGSRAPPKRSSLDVLYAASLFKFIRKEVLTHLFTVYRGGVYELYAILQAKGLEGRKEEVFTIFYDPHAGGVPGGAGEGEGSLKTGMAEENSLRMQPDDHNNNNGRQHVYAT